MSDSFSYLRFRIADDRQTVSFDYAVAHEGQTHSLTETMRFPVALRDTAQQRRALRALHLALGVSYYKTFLPLILTHPYQMDEGEAAFWNDVWRNGLGEFLYTNKLSPDKLAEFTAQNGTSDPDDGEVDRPHHAALLGIGGGKDSIVGGEALKKLGAHVEGFVMATGEQEGQARAVADTMGVHLHVVERALDRNLLELQELPGAYKGHVPISLIFGLVGAALATALDAAYVVVGNEASASIPRIHWEHGAVNHQWSKSLEFEKGLQDFIHERIAVGATYFSAVRPLTSVAIAKLFARYPQYLEVFTSDNSVFRIDPSRRPNARWSLDSPKSLSSFILLAPWLSEADALRAFGRDFLNEAELKKLFWELIGVEGEQPLDCVGTVDELVLSLNLACQQGKFATSNLMKLAQEKGVIVDKDWAPILQTMLALQPESALPRTLNEPLQTLYAEELA